MRLKYRDGNYQSTWNTMDQCGATCTTTQEGYFGGTATTSTQVGAVFAR